MIGEAHAEDTPDWPDELDAPIAKLGEPEGVHCLPGEGRSTALLVGFGLIVLSFVITYLYFFVLKWMVVLDKILFVVLFGPFVAGVMLISRTLRYRGLWVLRFPMGLLYWKKGELKTFPWHEVDAVVFHGYHKEAVIEFVLDDDAEPASAYIPLDDAFGKFQFIRIEVLRNDGEKIELPSNLIGFIPLGEAVQKEIYAKQWAALWEEFQEKTIVSFGKLAVTYGGIEKEKEMLPWSEFESAGVSGGQILVKRKGRLRSWADCHLHDMPNPHLFLALVERARPREISLPVFG